jgi:thiol-disulfide isomerase/thioredoxin
MRLPVATLPLLLLLASSAPSAGEEGSAPPLPDRPVWTFEIGDPFPPFVLDRLGGGKVSLPARGEITVLNVFASWCAPCRMEMPLLRCDVADRYAAEGVKVWGIDRGEPAPLVERFVGWIGIDYPVLLDVDRRFFGAISGNGAGIPKTILIDREGRVAWLENGYRPGITIGELAEQIEALLASRPAGTRRP